MYLHIHIRIRITYISYMIPGGLTTLAPISDNPKRGCTTPKIMMMIVTMMMMIKIKLMVMMKKLMVMMTIVMVMMTIVMIYIYTYPHICIYIHRYINHVNHLK
jgi:fatty-acid desaturase